MIEEKRNIFSCRLYNQKSNDIFDYKQSSQFSDINDLVLNLGYNDGSQFSGTLKINVESMLTNRQIMSISFSINSINNVNPTLILISDILSSNIDKYYKIVNNKTIYLLENKYINDSTWWYIVWNEFNNLKIYLESVEYDVLNFSFEVYFPDEMVTYENIMEYKAPSYIDSYVIGGFDCFINRIEQDIINYGFIVGNDTKSGLYDKDIEYIKTNFYDYEYFLVEIDDYGNSSLLQRKSETDIGDVINGKIIKTYNMNVPDNVFIDSLLLYGQINFNSSLPDLSSKVNKIYYSFEYSYFNPKIDIKKEKGSFIVGKNNDEKSFDKIYNDYINNYLSLVEFKTLYNKINSLYNYSIMNSDIGDLYINCINSYYYNFLQNVIIMPMKKAVVLWDSLIENNLKTVFFVDNKLVWVYRLGINDKTDFVFQIKVLDTWYTVERNNQSIYFNNGIYVFDIKNEYLRDDINSYSIRIMQIDQYGQWSYIPKPKLNFTTDNNRNIIISDKWELDESYINQKDPFKWESLRKILDIPWETWSNIIKNNFYNSNYNNYADLIKTYVNYYYDSKVSYNTTIKFNGTANGMSLNIFKLMNNYWKNIYPFGLDVNDSDVEIAYIKFKSNGYSPIWLKTSFLYVEPYFYDKNVQVIENDNKYGIRAFIYNKTYAETLNNLNMPIPDGYKVLDNANVINDDFSVLDVYYKNDVIKHPSINKIQYFNFNDALSDLMGSLKYNSYVNNEDYFILFFINKNIYNRHHIKFKLVNPSGISLSDSWWQEKQANKATKTKNIENYINKNFDGEITFWKGMNQNIVNKYAPTTDSNGNLVYKDIEDQDINEFYDFIELVNINSLK